MSATPSDRPRPPAARDPARRSGARPRGPTRQRAHLRGAPSRPPPARSSAPAKAPTRSLLAPGDARALQPRSSGSDGGGRRKPSGGDGERARDVVAQRGGLWDTEFRRSPRVPVPAGAGLQVPKDIAKKMKRHATSLGEKNTADHTSNYIYVCVSRARQT
ncbi:EZH inhibitory protein-like [Canis lupus familiaris]|uniref:EZH inhibitory protein-like n=1 Tax=Canis lupus familiaris TaxID=9615 RepID=UPI0018F7D138|nr:EZH inhibitory protein-like [Canis lupus familiaris]